MLISNVPAAMESGITAIGANTSSMEVTPADAGIQMQVIVPFEFVTTLELMPSTYNHVLGLGDGADGLPLLSAGLKWIRHGVAMLGTGDAVHHVLSLRVGCQGWARQRGQKTGRLQTHQ